MIPMRDLASMMASQLRTRTPVQGGGVTAPMPGGGNSYNGATPAMRMPTAPMGQTPMRPMRPGGGKSRKMPGPGTPTNNV